MRRALKLVSQGAVVSQPKQKCLRLYLHQHHHHHHPQYVSVFVDAPVRLRLVSSYTWTVKSQSSYVSQDERIHLKPGTHWRPSRLCCRYGRLCRQCVPGFKQPVTDVLQCLVYSAVYSILLSSLSFLDRLF